MSVALATVVVACGPPARPPEGRELTVWRPLGKWSGDSPLQTDSFISDTGMLRVTWEAREKPGVPAVLRVAVHSAVSGRVLAVAVEHRGGGRGTAYVNEDPREFFLRIDPTNVDWSVEAAEGLPGVASGSR